MRAWLNGDLLADPTQGAVAVTDHGFTVGDGVFEAVKTLAGSPFALARHLDRLERSAAGLGLPAPDLDDVRRGVEAVVGDAPIGRLRITYTAGPHPMGSGRGGGPPTLVVAWSAIDFAAKETTVVTVPWTRNENGATAGLKTTSYADNVIALAHAAERGGSEAVFANTAGNLCEGTGTNVFYVVDGELRTPTLASGCLAGVTRALVIEWCGRARSTSRSSTCSPTPARRSWPPRRATCRRSPAGTTATCRRPARSRSSARRRGRPRG